MKHVYAVCGSGVATSTMIKTKIQKYLDQKGIAAKVDTTTFGNVAAGGTKDADLLVSTNPNIDGKGVPVIGCVALLTGMGEQAVLEQIYQALK